MNIKFYDTCSLLLAKDYLSKNKECFYVSSVTLEELENIKTSSKKDENVKYAARQVLHFLNSNLKRFTVIFYTKKQEEIINKLGLELTNDNKIISCVPSNCTFISNDLNCKLIANKIFHLKVDSFKEEEDNYNGYKEVILHNADMADFYQHLDHNTFDLYNNEYLIVKDEYERVIDRLKWTGLEYKSLKFESFKSTWFGDVRPMRNDPYQMCLFDSLVSNDITMIGGPAGTGKTFISFAFLFSLLERGQIDRIVVFCNPITAKNAAKLGYYKGTMLDKVLSSQAGNILKSKLGGIQAVEDLLNKEQLIIVPAADARGYEVPPNSGVYIMESQNLDTTLLRLLLQRIGKDSKVIVDGDRMEQTDLYIYKDDNGMKKMSEVFRGERVFGQVDLKKIYRSEIANIAERMK